MMKLKKTGKSKMFATKQNITVSHGKKIVTLQEFTDFQKIFLKQMGLFEDEGVKSKILSYSLCFHFWTCIELEITLSEAGNICTKIC